MRLDEIKRTSRVLFDKEDKIYEKRFTYEGPTIENTTAVWQKSTVGDIISDGGEPNVLYYHYFMKLDSIHDTFLDGTHKDPQLEGLYNLSPEEKDKITSILEMNDEDTEYKFLGTVHFYKFTNLNGDKRIKVQYEQTYGAMIRNMKGRDSIFIYGNKIIKLPDSNLTTEKL